MGVQGQVQHRQLCQLLQDLFSDKRLCVEALRRLQRDLRACQEDDYHVYLTSRSSDEGVASTLDGCE